MLKTIRDLLICALLLALTAIAGRIYFFVGTAENVMIAAPKLIEDQISQVHADLSLQLSAAIGDVNDRLSDSISMVDRQVSAVRKDAVQEISATREVIQGPVLDKVDARLAAIERDANGSLVTLNGTLAETAKPFRESTQQINLALPDFLDCEFNENCVFNRYQGLAKSMERTSQVVAAEAPKMSASVQSIAESSAGVAASADATGKEVAIAAKRFNQPQSKLAALRSWLITIARIYGAI